LDVQYINPFVLAVKTVFKTMLSVDIALGKPAVRADYLTSADVTGLLLVSGGRKGFVRLCLTKKVALFVYRTLLFEEGTEINGDVIDAVGEVMNIVAGQARKEIEGASLDVKVEAPQVYMGQGMEHYPQEKLPVLCLPLIFSMEGEQETISADFAIA
jgi:chemotaxis protein CheX